MERSARSCFWSFNRPCFQPVSTFPANVVVRGQLNSLSGFFVAVFFLTMGALAELPKWKDFEAVLAVGKIPAGGQTPIA